MVDFKKIFIILFSLASFTPLLSQTQKGKATFYSKRATGARTASGVRVHHDSLTCAHRTYPFGTLLKVTNISNNKWVVVKVTDRGPFARGRIIDLSWRAAKELDILSKGVCTVKVELYKENPGIPFRPDETANLPELDFEITESEYVFTEEWAERTKATTKHTTTHKKKTTSPQNQKNDGTQNVDKNTKKTNSNPHADKTTEEKKEKR